MIKRFSHHRPWPAGLFAVALVGVMFAATMAETAQAQQRGPMFGQPYNFPLTNRANNAIVMKQVESGMFSQSTSGGTTGVTAGSSTLLICGGGGGGSETNTTSDATGNSSCVILNNSTGGLTIGQDSDGDQSADSDATGADAVSEVLNGDASNVN